MKKEYENLIVEDNTEGKIKVLILEDLPTDAELAKREVSTVITNFTALVVDTEKDFIEALETFKPNLIISDYQLPTFNGLKALKITRDRGLSIPFIILTGSMNEDTAVECMKAGADDYVIKEHIKHLGTSILNSLDKNKKNQERKQVEEKLKASENKFRKAFMTSPDSININRLRDGLYVEINKGFTKIMGYSEDDVIGKTSLELNIWENPIDRNKLVSGLQADGYVENLDAKFITKSGELKDGLMSATIIELNNEPHILSITRDITERKYAEIALKESEKKYHLIFENIQDVFYETDVEGTILEISPSIKLLSKGKYSRSELIGKKMSDFYLKPETRFEFIQALIKNKRLVDYEVILKNKDDTHITCSLSAVIQADLTGNPSKIIGSIRDITKRNQAEQNLIQSENRYKYLYDEAPVSIWEEDYSEVYKYLQSLKKKGITNFKDYFETHHDEVDKCLKMMNVIDVNETTVKMFHAKNKKELLTNLSSIITKESFLIFIEQLCTISRHETHYSGESINKTIDGKTIAVSFIWNVVPGYEKDYSKVLVSFTDITERKQAEEKEKEHHRNIKLISETAMTFVEFQQDENIYTYIGDQLQGFIGKDSFVIVNSVDEEAHSSTIQAVLGMGKFTEKISKLLGRHPVGITIDVEDPNIHYTDGKLHVYKEGLYGLLLNTVPKTICDSIEKLLKIKKIYVIDLAKQEHFFGSIIILLKDGANEFKSKQVIETFIKQASIAVQKRQAELSLMASENRYKYLYDLAPVSIWEEDYSEVYEYLQSLKKKGINNLRNYFEKHHNEVDKCLEMMHVVDVNETAVKMFHAKNKKELLTNLSSIITKESFSTFIEQLCTISRNETHYSGESINKTIDGKTIAVSLLWNVVPGYKKNYSKVLFSLVDITERKKSEEQISKDLREKTVLLQELYHRTKNNMQVIVSMMKMQSRRSDNEYVNTSFTEIINKINAMSLVHQKLYEAKDLSKINLKEYIEDLIHLIRRSSTLHIADVSLNLELEEDIFVLIDAAVPLGLVINELISNILKHAFPNRGTGEISIQLFQEEDKTINLKVSDNGIGLPQNFNIREEVSMGLSTIFSLTEKQLKGEILVSSDKGLHWHIKIKDNLYKQRV